MHDVRVVRLPHDQPTRHHNDIYHNNILNNSNTVNNLNNKNIHLNYHGVNNPTKEIQLFPCNQIVDNYTSNRSPAESPPLMRKQLKTALNAIHPLTNNNIVIMNSGLKDIDSISDHHYFINGFIPQPELSKSSSAVTVDNIKKQTSGHQQQYIGKENGKSILKKSFPQLIQLRNMIDLQGPQKDRPRSVPCAPRKVEFRPSVLVFLFDKIEGSHVRSESHDLTSEPKDRKKFLIRNNLPIKQKLFQTSNGLTQTNIDVALDSLSPTVHIVLPQGTKHLVPKRLSRGSLTDDDIQIKSYVPGLIYRSVTPSPNNNNNINHNFHIKDINNNHLTHLTNSNRFNGNGTSKKLVTNLTNVNQNNNGVRIIANNSLSSPPPLPSPPSLSTTKTSPNNFRHRTHSLTSDYHTNTDNMTSTININDVDFVFFEDENCRLWLRFVLDLGFGVSASDVLVKANLAGNKVRIVGTRLKNGVTQEFNERCTLPMEVDPYMIIARMDNNGKLFVEGLIMTPDRKKFLNRQQKLK